MKKQRAYNEQELYYNSIEKGIPDGTHGLVY